MVLVIRSVFVGVHEFFIFLLSRSCLGLGEGIYLDGCVSQIQYGHCFSGISHLNDKFWIYIKNLQLPHSTFFPFASTMKVTFSFSESENYTIIANRSDKDETKPKVVTSAHTHRGILGQQPSPTKGSSK